MIAYLNTHDSTIKHTLVLVDTTKEREINTIHEPRLIALHINIGNIFRGFSNSFLPHCRMPT
jgi:hypothetical protein